jgi:nitroimidazol reductase NimA-like FMN-containing flavoprotein (pyridoxamine 5'-phosphate oxidase superfamily)
MDAVEPIEILSETECAALLSSVEVGRLAIAIADLPEIYPVNFVVDDGHIVFRTAEGTKLAGAVLGRGVAFEVDGYEPSDGHAWSVMVKGVATEIEKMEEVFAAADLPLFPWHNGPKHRFVRIDPTEITGRRFRVTR